MQTFQCAKLKYIYGYDMPKITSIITIFTFTQQICALAVISINQRIHRHVKINIEKRTRDFIARTDD